MIYPTSQQIRNLDDLEKWLTEKTEYKQAIVPDILGNHRIQNIGANLGDLSAFVKEELIRTYLLHHQTLKVCGKDCGIHIAATEIPAVYKLTFYYLPTSDND